MTIDAKAHRALQLPDTKAVPIEMTPERKRVFGLVIDLLRRECNGPVEAYVILHFVQLGFEENYGIRGAIAVGNEGHS